MEKADAADAAINATSVTPFYLLHALMQDVSNAASGTPMAPVLVLIWCLVVVFVVPS